MLRDFLHLAVSMNTLPHKCVIPGEDQESRSRHHENLLRLYLGKKKNGTLLLE